MDLDIEIAQRFVELHLQLMYWPSSRMLEVQLREIWCQRALLEHNYTVMLEYDCYEQAIMIGRQLLKLEVIEDWLEWMHDIVMHLEDAVRDLTFEIEEAEMVYLEQRTRELEISNNELLVALYVGPVIC